MAECRTRVEPLEKARRFSNPAIGQRRLKAEGIELGDKNRCTRRIDVPTFGCVGRHCFLPGSDRVIRLADPPGGLHELLEVLGCRGLVIQKGAQKLVRGRPIM
jgi:hypothetical protein